MSDLVNDSTPGEAAIAPGPVLAVCGWSGSGKTTVLSQVIPELVKRGLAVATVKHDAHGIQVDPRGKDSDLLFEAGADVMLHAPGQSLIRTHAAQAATGTSGSRDGSLAAAVAILLADYDLVLVEGHKSTPLPKVWLASEEDPAPPEGIGDVRAILPWGASRAESLLRIIDDWLPLAWYAAPVYAGVLVGGRSRRMGWPKQLLQLGGKTFLERVVEPLEPFAERLLLLGGGPLPESCAHLPRLPDPPGLDGPLAGILAGMRWNPGATWLVAACDQPMIRAQAVRWLLDRRTPGKWAILPRVSERGREPLLAVYDARARKLLESLAASGCLAPSALAEHQRTLCPKPPPELKSSWRNVNTREEFETLEGEESA
jgi:molybdopterin-guanine dinucleotide biosynthesis protein MobB